MSAAVAEPPPAVEEETGPETIQLPDLNPRQQQVFDLIRKMPHDGTGLIGFGGGVGGGKSHLIVRLAINFSVMYPGNRGMIGRKEFNKLQTTTLEEFDEVTASLPGLIVRPYNVPPVYRDLRVASWPARVHSRVYFRGLEDWQSLGSEEYGHVYIDEASEVDAEVPLMLWTRLRHQLPKEIRWEMNHRCYVCGGRSQTARCKFHGNTIGTGMKKLMFAASNPWPGWFEDWFLKGQIDHEMLAAANASFHFVPSLIKDNAMNLPPGYEQQQRALLEKMAPGLARRLLDGEWGVVEGTVYTGFNPELHEWRGEDLMQTRNYTKVIGGLDFGNENESTGHFSAGIVGVVTKAGRLVRVAEFKERGPDIAERQQMWMLLQEKLWAEPIKKRIIWKADRSQMVGIQMMRKMFKVAYSTGGNDSVNEGIKIVAARLQPDGAGLPGSYYLPGLKKFKTEMTTYRRDLKTLKVVKVDDDLVACDRYMHELLEATVGDPQKLFRNVLPVMSE